MNDLTDRRRVTPISDSDIERIAEAVSVKARSAFHVEEETHYNSHKRLDVMLTAYDNATNIFWKTFLACVIVGAIILAGISFTKGK